MGGNGPSVGRLDLTSSGQSQQPTTAMGKKKSGKKSEKGNKVPKLAVGQRTHLTTYPPPPQPHPNPVHANLPCDNLACVFLRRQATLSLDPTRMRDCACEHSPWVLCLGLRLLCGGGVPWGQQALVYCAGKVCSFIVESDGRLSHLVNTL